MEYAAARDSQGVTADFNLNTLHHANRLLNANFVAENFEHVAFYNEEERRIEMHLQSRQDQVISCDEANISFRAGERLHTEYSYKYSLEDFASLASAAGFTAKQTWVDPDQLFSVQYFEVA